MASRTRRVTAALILLAATLGLPAALGFTVGDPLRQWPALRAGDSSDATIIALFAAVFYLAWASFVVPLLVEIVTVVTARFTGRPQRQVRLPLLGRQHDLARALLGAVLLLTPTTASTVMSAHTTAAPIPVATVLPATTGPGATSTPSVGAAAEPAAGHLRRYVIPATGGMRSYWDLAVHFLGDGTRWREIWQMNAGRVHDDGRAMDSPNRLAAGWTVLLPARADAASGPANEHDVTVRRGDTLSGLAAAGGITDWQRVWIDNAHRPEPEGRRFDDPDLILPGWTIHLPDRPNEEEQHATPVPTQPHRPPLRTGLQRRPSDVRSDDEPAPGPAPGGSARPALDPTPADSAVPTSPRPGTSRPPAAVPHEDVDRDHNPLPVELEVGLAALAAVTVLDRARRIAQRRRRRGHRLAPPPAPLAAVERELRRDARRARPAAAAVHLATALAGSSAAQLRAVIARDDGAVDLLVEPATAPPAPFTPTDGGWRLPADASGFTFAVDDAADPYPALIPVGRNRHGDVLIDLAAASPVGVAGDTDHVRRYLAGLVRAFAGAPWADRISMHIPASVAALVGPLDRVHVDDHPTPHTGTPAPHPHGETATLGWCTTPIDLYCGYDADRSASLMAAAADSPDTVLVVLTGMQPGAAIWTLDAEQLTIPELSAAVTVALTDSTGGPSDTDIVRRPDGGVHAHGLTDLLTHTATAEDIPTGDPRLPDYGTEAPPTVENTPQQLNVLGPVELSGTEHPRRSQTLNLLVYLAFHRRGADRDQIATALWPEHLTSNKTLRNRIHEARVLVGHAISDGPRWRLDEAVTTDWQRFTALARGTHAQQHEALSLVRGRPFAGLDGVEWIDHEGLRSEVEAAIVDLALTVAERDLAAGDFDAAYTAARAGLAASRYDERLHRVAIRAAHAQGATSKVRSQQLEMRTVLDSDIEPDDQTEPETIALYDELETARATRGE